MTAKVTTKTTARKPATRRASGAKSKANQTHAIQLEGHLGIVQTVDMMGMVNGMRFDA